MYLVVLVSCTLHLVAMFHVSSVSSALPFQKQTPSSTRWGANAAGAIVKTPSSTGNLQMSPFQKFPQNKFSTPRTTIPKLTTVKPQSTSSDPHVNAASQFFPPSHNRIPLNKSDRQGSVWSEWVDLPNPLIKNWHLLLKNVSYVNGVLNIHLPENSNKTVSGLKSLYSLRVVHTPLDMATCSTVETRTVTHVFPGWSKNAFLTNAGHFNINVLNPLFLYLFFVHNRLPDLKDESAVADHQLPLDNTLLLIKSDMMMSKAPVFLFDVVLRFASSYMHLVDYLAALPPGGTHCFDSIDVPLYDPVDHANPEKKNVPVSYGLWDTMHFSHKGRWGRLDFYKNFWRNVKRQIWQLYDIPVTVAQHLRGAALSHSSGDAVPAPHHGHHKQQQPQESKPKLAFMARPGSGSARYDGNINEVGSLLQKDFEVMVFGAEHYRWHAGNESLRFQQTHSTLLLVQQADIMLGQGGSNMQLALFLEEGKLVAEIKNYCPCCNEGGKNLANHNRLAFHMLRGTDVAVFNNKMPVRYTRPGLTKLSAELVAAWRANVESAQHESRQDSWPATCDFLWPHQDPSILARTSLLTRSNVSHCYLEQVPGLGWYQLGKHKNSNIAACYEPDVPYGTSVTYCMISGLC